MHPSTSETLLALGDYSIYQLPARWHFWPLHVQEIVDVKFVFGRQDNATLDKRRDLLILGRRFDRINPGEWTAPVGNGYALPTPNRLKQNTEFLLGFTHACFDHVDRIDTLMSLMSLSKIRLSSITRPTSQLPASIQISGRQIIRSGIGGAIGAPVRAGPVLGRHAVGGKRGPRLSARGGVRPATPDAFRRDQGAQSAHVTHAPIYWHRLEFASHKQGAFRTHPPKSASAGSWPH